MSEMAKAKLSRREMLAVTGLSAAGAVLAACQPKVIEVTKEVEVPVKETVVVQEEVEVPVEVVVTATPEPTEPVTLHTMYHAGMPDPWIATYRKILDEFQEFHNNMILVEPLWVPEAWDKIQTEYAAGGGPDVIINQMDWMVPGAARGMFVNLIPFINRDGIDMSAYWYDHSLEWEWKGGLYALLLYAGGQALYVNKARLAEAGLEFPSDDWTWDDLLSYGKQLTDEAAGKWGIMGTSWNPPYWSCAFIHGNGGSVLNDKLNECTIDEPEAQEALQWIHDLIYVHKVQPTGAAIAGLDDQFLAGNVAFSFNGTWFESSLRDTDLDWDFARMPVHPTTKLRSVQLGSNAWSILTTTKYLEQSWQLVKWLGTEPGQKGFMGTGLPGLRSVIESPEYQQAHAPQKITRLIDDFSCCGHNYYPTPDCGQWWSAMGAELDLIWSDERSVEESTRAACEAVERIFAERPEEWGM
jgi:ABC-type glycerol-3-phosphate transport system substrate-binding protein